MIFLQKEIYGRIYGIYRLLYRSFTVPSKVIIFKNNMTNGFGLWLGLAQITRNELLRWHFIGLLREILSGFVKPIVLQRSYKFRIPVSRFFPEVQVLGWTIPRTEKIGLPFFSG